MKQLSGRTNAGAPLSGSVTSSLQAALKLDTLPLREMKQMLALISQQYAPIFAQRKRIAIVGPVNTGKSSLYNVLIGSSAPKARVSPVPGTTRQTQIGDADVFWVIDTPGVNEVEVGAEGPRDSRDRRDAALDAARQADVIVIVFDAARGIAHDEVVIYNELMALHKPSIVVLNKIDLVGDSSSAVIHAAATTLQLPVDQIIATSALRGTNLNHLLLALVEAEPQILATLAEALPNSRWLLATKTIISASVAAATANIATAPFSIPFASFAIITPIQIGMVLSLARVFGRNLTPAVAKEIALTFGAAVLGRRLFYYLANLVPVAGWALGTGVAAGTTMALGYGIATWLATGQKLSQAGYRGLAEDITRSLLKSIKDIPDRRSAGKSIPSIVADAWTDIGSMTAAEPDSTAQKLHDDGQP